MNPVHGRVGIPASADIAHISNTVSVSIVAGIHRPICNISPAAAPESLQRWFSIRCCTHFRLIKFAVRLIIHILKMQVLLPMWLLVIFHRYANSSPWAFFYCPFSYNNWSLYCLCRYVDEHHWTTCHVATSARCWIITRTRPWKSNKPSPERGTK